MGLIQNFFELLTDKSHETVEEESSREVLIALAGNSAEVRDRLQQALSARLESLWTSNPFRVVETVERPTMEGESAEGRLVLYALYEGQRLPDERKNWLEGLAANPGVPILITVLPRPKEGIFEPERRRNALQKINPLRLIGGNTENKETPAPNSNSTDEDLHSFTENESNIKLVKLSGLEVETLQSELLPMIVERLSGRELALARRAPIFRNAVADHFILRAARDNAETVLLSNIFANVPFLSDLFGGGADFLLLSKNQFELSNRLASLYGQKRANRFEIWLELAPIVGSAFIWRLLSRAAADRLPRFLSLLPKAAIAYGATFVVGQVARYYYANGRTAPTEIVGLIGAAFERFRQRGNSKPAKNDEPPFRLRSV